MQTTAINPEESDESLIRSFLFFREDYNALAGGAMKDEAALHMRDLAAELRRRGPESYAQLVKAVDAYKAERKRQWAETLAARGRKPKEAV